MLSFDLDTLPMTELFIVKPIVADFDKPEGFRLRLFFFSPLSYSITESPGLAVARVFGLFRNRLKA